MPKVAGAKERLSSTPPQRQTTHSGMADSRPRVKTGGRSTSNPGAMLADCLIVAMVVVPWIGFACLCGPFLWGGLPPSGWLDDTTLLSMAAITYCAGLLLVLCRWLIWPWIRRRFAGDPADA